MGVYIKGLNKKDISDLRVHKYGGTYEFVEYEDIIEVKTPHGRLIDTEILKDSFMEKVSKEELCVFDDERYLPTVIEMEAE